jgi:acyl-CoA:acyl-CoA alkyltransferase
MNMQYENVCLESFGYTLPKEVVTTAQLEKQLEPLYRRLRLPTGRLELISGIQARRFWPVGTLPSGPSRISAQRALEAADFPATRIGALLHGSVCRDRLEPATACRVHHGLGLPESCQILDVSNACLGLLNAIVQIANMIELGQIDAGLAVGTEGSRQLVENTVRNLNENPAWTRQSIKGAIASLTIGSASCAVLLTHRSLSRTQNRLLGGVVRARTAFHELCQSGQDEGADTMQPLMHTDSERLLEEGVAAGADAFEQFLHELGWSRESLDATVCHQVGTAHRKRMLETLQLDSQTDFTSVEWLGNTGSVALPITAALAAERGDLSPDRQLGLLGIGSGINCLMLGVHWQHSLVRGGTAETTDAARSISPVPV